MAVETQSICGLSQHRIVVTAVRIVASEAGDAMPVHEAGHKVVALHPVFMCGTIGKMRERGGTKFMVFQLPKVVQLFAHLKTNRPIIVPAVNRITQRPAL